MQSGLCRCGDDVDCVNERSSVTRGSGSVWDEVA